METIHKRYHDILATEVRRHLLVHRYPERTMNEEGTLAAGLIGNGHPDYPTRLAFQPLTSDGSI